MAADKARPEGLTVGLKWGPFAILVFWVALMGVVYLAMEYYLKPQPVVVTAAGDLVVPKARDGHFYAAGSVNGKPVNFLIDTGATLVIVSESFAAGAGMSGGAPTVFRTANGDLPGRVIRGVPVAIGPVSVSSVTIGVGLVGRDEQDALLGQSFLSKFDIVLSRDQMVLKKR